MSDPKRTALFRSAALAAVLAGLLGVAVPAQAQRSGPDLAAKGLEITAQVELSNVPRSQLTIPDFNLIETHLTGRLPTLSARFEHLLAPEVMGVVSGSLRQEIYQALSYPDLYQAELDRIQWRRAGGLGWSPLYVPILEDAYVDIFDRERNGYLRVGQFELPFGYQASTYEPPLPVAPVPTPVTEYLSAQGQGLYQGSAFGRWYDIGTLLQWRTGSFGYASGILNGSGPNRMDDNGAKDLFFRLDYRAESSDEIGISLLWGREIAYPDGFSAEGRQTERRRAGLHARFVAGESTALFEYLVDQRLGLESVPRQGWYVDLSQTLGPQSSLYVQYSAFGDGNAAGGRHYEAKQVTLGGKQQIWEQATLRLEGLWRWESATGIATNYGRYLATLEFALGGAASATNPRLSVPTLRSVP